MMQFSTVQAVDRAFKQLTGTRPGVLKSGLGVLEVTTLPDYLAHMSAMGVAVNEQRLRTTMALYEPRRDRLVFFADRIPAGRELPVIAHELVHKNGRAVLDEVQWTSVLQTLRGWQDRPRQSPERQIYEEAHAYASSQQARSSGETGAAIYDEELFAVAVETAVAMGVEADPNALQESASEWLSRAQAVIQKILDAQVAHVPADLTPRDLVDLACAFARIESIPEGAKRLSIIERLRAGLSPEPPAAGEASSRPAFNPGPVLFSRLQRALAAAPRRMDGFKAHQWMAWIESNASRLGVKQEEIDWSGLPELFSIDPEVRFTREGLIEHLSTGGLRVQEELLGGPAPDGFAIRYLAGQGWQAAGPDGQFWGGYANEQEARAAVGAGPQSKYPTYTVPGGKNYCELLLTLSERPNESMNFRSTHWSQANVLVHARVDEREDALGRPILFVHEIQSDWGQGANRRGIRGRFPSEVLAAAIQGGMPSEQARSDIQMLLKEPVATADRDTAGAWRRLQAATQGSGIDLNEVFHDRQDASSPSAGVPNAPFVGKTQQWVALAVKSLALMAVRRGLSGVVFVSAEQANAMFSLNKHVGGLYYTPQGVGRGTLVAMPPGSSIHDAVEPVLVVDDVGPDDLAKHVGKHLATQLMAAPVQDGFHALEEEGIRVRNNGLVTFYDEIVPSVVADVLKKCQSGEWPNDRERAQVSRMALPMPAPEAADSVSTAVSSAGQWGFVITPELRETLLQTGLPLFRSVQNGRITQTPEFQRWFGASVAVDGHNQPKPFYHLTLNDFSTFEKTWDLGFHFAASPAAANKRLVGAARSHRSGITTARDVTGASVMPVYLSIRNPLHLNVDPGSWQPEYVLKVIGSTLTDDESERLRNLIEPLTEAARQKAATMKEQGIDTVTVRRLGRVTKELRHYAWMRVLADTYQPFFTALRHTLQAKGYDGLSYLNRHEKSGRHIKPRPEDLTLVAFSPAQIKSAIGNIGTFDPSQPDILKRDGAEPLADREPQRLRSVDPQRELATWFEGSAIRSDDGQPLSVFHYGSFIPSQSVMDRPMHFGTREAAAQRMVDKYKDDAAMRVTAYLGSEDEGGPGDEVGRDRWHFEDGEGYSSRDWNPRGFSCEDDAIAYGRFHVLAALENAGPLEIGDWGYMTEAHLNIKRPKRVIDCGDATRWQQEIERAQAEGYDGIVYRNRFEDIGSESYIVFEPSQVRIVRTMDVVEDDATEAALLRAISPTQTPEFQRWSEGAPLVKLHERPVFRSGRPVVVECLHGTTFDAIERFEPARFNTESNLGAGIYASNTASDVNANYATGDGPDLKGKIQHALELFLSDPEGLPPAAFQLKGLDPEEVHDEEVVAEVAKAYVHHQFNGDAPNTMKLYMKFRNPAVIGGRFETVFEYDMDEESTVPGGLLGDLLRQFYWDLDRCEEIGITYSDLKRVYDQLTEEMLSGDSLKLSTIYEVFQKHLYDPNSQEVLRWKLARLGFDGVIDSTVYDKFAHWNVLGRRIKNMDGLQRDTVHFVAFSPNQVKSATGNSGAFDPDDDHILRRESLPDGAAQDLDLDLESDGECLAPRP